MKRRNDFIYLLFLTLSHLKHMFPTSRCVSKATEIKDFCRTAPSTHALKQTSELKSASVFGKTTRGKPIIQNASCPETSSSAVAGSQTGSLWNGLAGTAVAIHPMALHTPHGPTVHHEPYFMSSPRNSSLHTPSSNHTFLSFSYHTSSYRHILETAVGFLFKNGKENSHYETSYFLGFSNWFFLISLW